VRWLVHSYNQIVCCASCRSHCIGELSDISLHVVLAVRRVGDEYYREIELPRMTLAHLKQGIAQEFGVPEDEIHSIIRDQQVLITQDVQLSNLSIDRRLDFSLQVDSQVPTTVG
jgi:hypothetical protein